METPALNYATACLMRCAVLKLSPILNGARMFLNSVRDTIEDKPLCSWLFHDDSVAIPGGAIVFRSRPRMGTF